MKKRGIPVVLFLLLSEMIFSQESVSTLKRFYDRADREYYARMAHENMEACYAAQCEKWNVSRETAHLPRPDLSEGHAVPMLAVGFLDMDRFDPERDNIYARMIIDSLRVFTWACLDQAKRVYAFANYFDGVYAYSDISSFRPSERERLQRVVSDMEREKPEMLLFSHTLGNLSGGDGFLYLKKGMIYVYRLSEGSPMELNHYVRQYLTEGELRDLGYTSVPFVHRYYGKEPEKRRAGATPANENRILRRGG